jgi:NDP-sugar pyrophosphorylase family protein
MHAVILAGGKGSRLRPFTFSIPKPLVPIGEIPIIELLIRQLATQGFTRATISVGHMAALIQSFCGDGRQWGLSIDYVIEDEPLGTVGGLGLIETFDDDRILLINGDTLTDLDFAAAYRGHKPQDAATICANTRTVDIDFGVLDRDPAGYLATYTEKPTLSYLVSMGTNVLTVGKLFEHLERGERLDWPELMARFDAAGERIKVINPDAYWLDLGRMSDLEEGTRVFTEDPGRFLGS